MNISLFVCYRLGHGDIIPADGRAAPFRVETLHMHKIRVIAVACGKEHTVALGDQGKVNICYVLSTILISLTSYW